MERSRPTLAICSVLIVLALVPALARARQVLHTRPVRAGDCAGFDKSLDIPPDPPIALGARPAAVTACAVLACAGAVLTDDRSVATSSALSDGDALRGPPATPAA